MFIIFWKFLSSFNVMRFYIAYLSRYKLVSIIPEWIWIHLNRTINFQHKVLSKKYSKHSGLFEDFYSIDSHLEINIFPTKILKIFCPPPWELLVCYPFLLNTLLGVSLRHSWEACVSRFMISYERFTLRRDARWGSTFDKSVLEMSKDIHRSSYSYATLFRIEISTRSTTTSNSISVWINSSGRMHKWVPDASTMAESKVICWPSHCLNNKQSGFRDEQILDEFHS